jgi:N-acetylglucosamine kinase-like BadF-type ATPase
MIRAFSKADSGLTGEACQVLAVDGGQSGIRIRHPAWAGDVELEGVSRLEGDIVASVAAAVGRAWLQSGSPVVDRCVLGLTTAPTDEPSQQRLCELVGTAVSASQVWLADDAVMAHAGALSMGWGVSVSVGTGVACMAAPREATPRIGGGHGYLLGDEGGAFWIGRAGIAAALRARERRAPATALTARVEDRFGGLGDLAERIYGLSRPIDAIARFAPDVLAVAELGDIAATTIVSAATGELATLLRAAVELIGPEPRDVPVALGGRLMEGGLLRHHLEEALVSTVPQAVARPADGTPLDGALLLGSATDTGRYDTFVYRWAAPVSVGP